MTDKYTEHIEAILADENPKERIRNDWAHGLGLFAYLTKSRRHEMRCGCATMVKSGKWTSEDGKLDKVVRASKLLPASDEDICPSRPMLEEFARIQRLADKEYGRV